MTIAPTLTKPPQVRSSDAAIQQIADYLWAQYKDNAQIYRLPQRMEDIASLAPLAMTVSNPPTQAEVQAIADRLDAIVAAARRTATT